MPILNTQIEQNVFKLFVQRVLMNYSVLEQRLTDHVRTQLLLGRSRKEILDELTVSLNNGMGIFKQLSGDLRSSLEFGLNTTFQVASNEPLKEAKAMMKWTLNPSAEHCESCLFQASQPPRPFGKIPFPGSQPTHGDSNCTSYCRCTLEVVGEEK